MIDDIIEKSYKDFFPIIPELCSMLSKLLIDQCPEVKNRISETIIKLIKVLGNKMGAHAKNICGSLCANLKHSHNKIRKITLQVKLIIYIKALCEVLLCENAGKNFEECYPLLKMSSNDKKPDVRNVFYSVAFKLINNFNIIHLRKYEHQLVILLMNGLGDDQVDIVNTCYRLLEEAGEHRLVI